ncbi:MAG: universal stress protein [Caldilineales bacterium]|nr:universal stress protein [Caldilineales bacterium]MDW8316226.1 universal stress protein [Anaerolineae bacterium]
MFQHLLVPLDGSPAAEAALPVARALAARCGGRLTLVHVIKPAPWPAEMRAELPDMESRVVDRELEVATAYLRHQEDALAAQGLAADALIMRRDSVVDGILEAVEEVGADAIVMSTHGLTGLPRLMLGSVAEQVVRHTPVPVVLVRSQVETSE